MIGRLRLTHAPAAGTDALLVVHPGDLDVAAGSPIQVAGTPRAGFDPQPQPFRDRFADDPTFEPYLDERYLEADGIDRTP